MENLKINGFMEMSENEMYSVTGGFSWSGLWDGVKNGLNKALGVLEILCSLPAFLVTIVPCLIINSCSDYDAIENISLFFGIDGIERITGE